MGKKQKLIEKIDRFYNKYFDELMQIAELLEIKLKQLALAYTITHKLPKESIKITTRVKTKKSFINKLKKKKWIDFYLPTEIVKDLIGARIVCWFIDDCYAFLDFLKQSNQLEILDTDTTPIKDYVKNPQPAGYRAIHLFSLITYDQVKTVNKVSKVEPGEMLCEIQIRTKLQDSWGDITHEFFYKAKNLGVSDEAYEGFLSSLAETLDVQDNAFTKFRKAYQKLIDEKIREDKEQEGFKYIKK